jgi:hypothetical protein
MPNMHASAHRLLARIGATGESAAIAKALADGAAEARGRWPTLAGHDERFVEAVAARVDGEDAVGAAIARLALSDVYLVAARVAGDRASRRRRAGDAGQAARRTPERRRTQRGGVRRPWCAPRMAPRSGEPHRDQQEPAQG